jgi:hypothetical protein
MIHHAMPPNAVADWDSTVVVRHGKQEAAAIGHNPQKPGRPSHHPLARVISGTRLCLHREWRIGKRPSHPFKLKLTANVKTALAAVPWDDWQGISH